MPMSDATATVKKLSGTKAILKKIWKRINTVTLRPLLKWLVEDHRYVFRLMLAMVGLVPSYWLVKTFESQHGIVMTGLNLFAVAYLADFLHLFVTDTSREQTEEVGLFNVFIVAWFLPFILTVTPTIQTLMNNYSIHPAMFELDHNLIVNLKSESFPIQQERLTDLKDRVFIPILLHGLLFSSLVVLVPLEFFALLFLKDKKKKKRPLRHSLITAGCLDVAMLAYLSLVTTDTRLAKIYDGKGQIAVVSYLVGLWILSFISSFQAIYVAQYNDPKDSGKSPQPGAICPSS